MSRPVILISAPELAAYGFPNAHPFGTDRHGAFLAELERSACFPRLQIQSPRLASREEIEYFHGAAYVDRVIDLSRRGSGYLDAGDTPAFRAFTKRPREWSAARWRR